MVKQIPDKHEQPKAHKNTKANRFQNFTQPQATDKKSWPTDAVVYIGHLPHGFYQEQLKSYFTQYGQVLAVKVARSKKTARSRGYAFIQFKYPQIASIVQDTMNGYLLLGKVLVSNVLPANERNPFSYPTAGKYKFINWKRIYMKEKNKVKNDEENGKIVRSLLKKEEQRKDRLKELGIDYEYAGFSSLIPTKTVKAPKSKSK